MILRAASFFGANNYNTICTARTIDGSGGCILQYFNRSYIVRTDRIKWYISWNAVYYQQGITIIYGSCTSYPNADIRTGRPGRKYLYAGSSSLQSFTNIGHWQRLNIFTVHRGN